MSTVVGPKLVFARPWAAAGKPDAGRIAEAATVLGKSRRLIMAANPCWLIPGGRPAEKLPARLLHAGARRHADRDPDQQDPGDLRAVQSTDRPYDHVSQAGTAAD